MYCVITTPKFRATLSDYSHSYMLIVLNRQDIPITDQEMVSLWQKAKLRVLETDPVSPNLYDPVQLAHT